jgi:hypothetical protein
MMMRRIAASRLADSAQRDAPRPMPCASRHHIVDGLATAHRIGIVDLDLKPGNVTDYWTGDGMLELNPGLVRWCPWQDTMGVSSCAM